MRLPVLGVWYVEHEGTGLSGYGATEADAITMLADAVASAWADYVQAPAALGLSGEALRDALMDVAGCEHMCRCARTVPTNPAP